jgi:hypothetical protein
LLSARLTPRRRRKVPDKIDLHAIGVEARAEQLLQLGLDTLFFWALIKAIFNDFRKKSHGGGTEPRRDRVSTWMGAVAARDILLPAPSHGYRSRCRFWSKSIVPELREALIEVRAMLFRMQPSCTQGSPPELWYIVAGSILRRILGV